MTTELGFESGASVRAEAAFDDAQHPAGEPETLASLFSRIVEKGVKDEIDGTVAAILSLAAGVTLSGGVAAQTANDENLRAVDVEGT